MIPRMRAWVILRWCVALAWLAALGLSLVLPAVGFCLPAWQAPVLPTVLAKSENGKREQVGAIIHVHLAGDSVSLGYDHGYLLADRIAALEGDLIDTFTTQVPTFPARHLLLGLVGFNNRSLINYFQPNELLEIAAACRAQDQVGDPWRWLGPVYQRAVQYHALHDVSQYLIDNPLVRPIQVGCSAVAIGGQRSRDGHLLVGRLFDFEGGPRFDFDKVVFTVHPKEGLRFLHVGWAGMTGAVTGLNEAGLWVSINAAATAGQGFCGRPITMVVRQVLQHCRTIDEAVAILAATPVFVSDGVLLASRDEHKVVVVELGPTGCAVRPWVDDVLISTNHFLHPQWAGDRANQERLRRGTTVARSARLAEICADPAGQDLASVARALRDRRGRGGQDIGFGNRSTVNAWIGAHLAVADLDAGVVWVAEPRHGLGILRAFTVNGPGGAADLPADPEQERCLHDASVYAAQRDALIHLLRQRQNPQRAFSLGQELLRLNPQSCEAHWLAGLATTDAKQQRALWEKALTLQPAYAEDADALRAALAGTAPMAIRAGAGRNP